MRNEFRNIILGSLGVILTSHTAGAWCNLDGYDSHDPPQSYSGVIDSPGDIDIEWGTDVDPYQDGERAWHYVRNRHPDKVTIDWPKTEIFVPFRPGLPEGEADCQKQIQTNQQLGEANQNHGEAKPRYFAIDDDAPIRVNTNPESGAVAYMRGAGAGSGRSSTSIETGTVRDGSTIPVSAEITVTYFTDDNYVSVDVTYEPPDFGVVVPRQPFNLSDETFAAEAIGEVGTLGNLISADADVLERYERFLGEPFVVFSGKGSHSFGFSAEGLGGPLSGPLLVVDPDRTLVMGGRFDFDGAARFGDN